MSKGVGSFGRTLGRLFPPPGWRRILLIVLLFAIGLSLHATEMSREVGRYVGAIALALLLASIVGYAIDAISRKRWWVLLWGLWVIPYCAFVISTPEGTVGTVFRVWLAAATVLIATYALRTLYRRRSQGRDDRVTPGSASTRHDS
jgi:hypothetical protein